MKVYMEIIYIINKIIINSILSKLKYTVALIPVCIQSSSCGVMPHGKQITLDSQKSRVKCCTCGYHFYTHRGRDLLNLCNYRCL